MRFNKYYDPNLHGDIQLATIQLYSSKKKYDELIPVLYSLIKEILIFSIFN